MSREIRRVPMDWQHPMVWRERWDRADGRTRMTLVPDALLGDYAGALSDWESRGRNIAAHEGHDWDFWHEYCLTGFQGREDTEPRIHQFTVWQDSEEVGIDVRDDDHLAELLTARHADERPNPADYMPDFSDRDPESLGWCMYETCSEGTPISPVMASPEELARWLADTGASAFGYQTATYEQWLPTCRSGWAPSAIAVGGHVISGVEALA